MADQQMYDKYREERPTKELLSLDWDEIYSVLAHVDENVKKGKNVYQVLVKNPKLARAIYQAQLELGIALDPSEAGPRRPPPMQTQYAPMQPMGYAGQPQMMPAPQMAASDRNLYQYVLNLKLSDFLAHTPEEQEKMAGIRKMAGLPPRPEM